MLVERYNTSNGKIEQYKIITLEFADPYKPTRTITVWIRADRTAKNGKESA